jgi:predicted anti-sigma-YlaC factor YlaD
MHCEEFKTRLDSILDDRLKFSGDPRLRAHARRCTGCAEWLQAHTALLTTVEKIPLAAPRADFSIRVLQSFDADQRRVQRQQRKRVTWAVAGLAIAAVLLLMVFNGRDPVPAVGPANVPHQTVQPLASLDYQRWLADADHITSQQRAWVSELAQGLKPVTSSVQSALHTLWRNLPANELALVLL